MIQSVSAGSSPMAHAVSSASMRQPPAQRMSKLFDRIDSAGSNTISRAQFEQAFQGLNPPKALSDMGAGSIFSKLDANNSGSVSRQTFVSGMSDLLAGLRGGGERENDGDGDDGASGNLAGAMQELESTLGGQAAPAGSSTAGSLFNFKA